MTLFLVYVALCFLLASVGRRRPFKFWGYFFISFLMTPVVGLLVLVATDRKRRLNPARR